jgi:Bacterial membrane protein YfhO
VLAQQGFAAPPGTVPVATIAGEVLARVPDSGRFTIGATVLSSTHPGDARYLVRVRGHAGPLVARITDSPGWRASADGRPLVVRDVDGAFLGVTVPAGTDVVTFSYRMPHLTEALVLEFVTIAGFAAAGLLALARRRRVRVPQEPLASPR